MASANWEKASVGKVKKMRKHFDDRVRGKTEHTNKNIDPAKTPNNVTFGGNFDTITKRLENRVKELDAACPPIRMRKDRVTALLIELSIPAAISSQGKAKDFCADVLCILADQIGKENVAGAFMHVDEVHTYIDPETRDPRDSLEHLHIVAVPDAGGRVNGKEAVTRTAMRRLNNAIEKICNKKYGCKFMTGKEAKGKSVEQLKAESALAESIAKRQQEEEKADRAYEYVLEMQRKLGNAKYEAELVRAETERLHHNIGVLRQREAAMLQAAPADDADGIKHRGKHVKMSTEDYESLMTAVDRARRILEREAALEQAEKKNADELKDVHKKSTELTRDREGLEKKIAEAEKESSDNYELARKTLEVAVNALERLPARDRRRLTAELGRGKGYIWSSEVIAEAAGISVDDVPDLLAGILTPNSTRNDGQSR